MQTLQCDSLLLSRLKGSAFVVSFSHLEKKKNNSHLIEYLWKLTFQTKNLAYKEFLREFIFPYQGESMKKEVSAKYTQTFLRSLKMQMNGINYSLK